MKRWPVWATLLIVNCGGHTATDGTRAEFARRNSWGADIDTRGFVRIRVGDLGEISQLLDSWVKNRAELERIEGRKLRPQFVYVRPNIGRQVK